MQDGPPVDSSGIVSVEEALVALEINPSERFLEAKQLSGGLTNDNILIKLKGAHEGEKGKRIVLRRFCFKTGKHLGYDRDEEYRNSCKTGLIKGVGATVLCQIRSTEHHGGAIALDFVDGQTLDEISMKILCNSKDGLVLLADTLRKVHGTPVSFENRFDPFEARKFYEKQVKIMTGRPVQWPTYKAIVEQSARIELYLQKVQEKLVDCHNDLLSANLIISNDHKRLTIVDWELAGQAEPSWELGNFISENGLDENEHVISSLLSHYWSQLRAPEEIEEKIRRAKLFSVVSKITWAAWGAVLHNIDKTNTFDYEEWCMQKLQRADKALKSHDTITKLMQ